MEQKEDDTEKPMEKAVDDLLLKWDIPHAHILDDQVMNTRDHKARRSSWSFMSMIRNLNRRAIAEWLPGPWNELCIAALEQTEYQYGQCHCSLCRQPRYLHTPCLCSPDGVRIKESR